MIGPRAPLDVFAAVGGCRYGACTMKSYKPLVSSAPAHSILNAQTFRYRNSADTDVRRTFERLRRHASRNDVLSGDSPLVRTFTKPPRVALPPALSRLPQRSFA